MASLFSHSWWNLQQSLHEDHCIESFVSLPGWANNLWHFEYWIIVYSLFQNSSRKVETVISICLACQTCYVSLVRHPFTVNVEIDCETMERKISNSVVTSLRRFSGGTLSQSVACNLQKLLGHSNSQLSKSRPLSWNGLLVRYLLDLKLIQAVTTIDGKLNEPKQTASIMHSSKVMAAFENSMLEIIAAAVDDYKTLPTNSCHLEPAIDTKDELDLCKDQLMD